MVVIRTVATCAALLALAGGCRSEGESKAPSAAEPDAKSAVAASPVEVAAGEPQHQDAKEAPARPAEGSKLKLLDAAVAKDIVEREPEGAGARFPNDVGGLWAWVKVANEGERTRVTTVWRQGDEEKFRIDLNVGTSAGWRTWSKKTIGEGDVGEWTVDVLGPGGELLRSLPFTVVAAADDDGEEAADAGASGDAKAKADSPEPAPEAAPAGCRALVNIAATPREAGGPTRTVYVVADVRPGASPALAWKRGTVVRDEGKSWALTIEERKEKDEGEVGSLERRWDELWALELGTGVRKRWLTVEPARELPPADADPETENVEYVAEHRIGITAVVGPWISLFLGQQGQYGGVHGTDTSRYETLAAPDGAPADPFEIAGSTAVRRLEAEVAEERQRRADDGGLEVEMPNADERTRAAFRIDPGPGEKPGIYLHTLLFCCTWAENHNLLDLGVRLDPVPAVLKPAAATNAGGLFVAPDGCGSVGWEKERLVAKARGAAESTLVSLPGLVPERILGIIWLPADDPFDLKRLP